MLINENLLFMQMPVDDDDDGDEDGGSFHGSVASVAENTRTDVDGEAFYDASDSLTPSQRKPAATPASQAAARTTPVAPVIASTTIGVPEPEWLKGTTPPVRRRKLPEPEETQKSVSLWGIIKECIGKDLTRICLPVYFNEPLSALQKMTEEFQYASLLEKAAAAPKASVDRLMFVAIFALSGYALPAPRCRPRMAHLRR